MKQRLLRLLDFIALFGLDAVKVLQSLRRLPAYYAEFRALKRQQKSSPLMFPFGRPWPCLFEKTASFGKYDVQYLYQDLLVARKIFEANPRIHADVGSRIDGFVTHVASFRTVHVLDIRPLEHSIPNVVFTQCDLMEELPEGLTGYCDSLSCLHVLEHFGLGRYGDEVCFYGHVTGFSNLRRILKPGGKLYFSVPIGPQRIEFNAHRVFSVEYLLELMGGEFRIDSFSLVDDRGRFRENVPFTADRVEDNFGCDHGCGIFELTKLAGVID